MTDAIVTYASVAPNGTVAVSGGPVGSIDAWTPLGAGVNWLNATGAQLVCASTRLAQNQIAGGATGVFRFKAYTRVQAIQRIWVVQLVGLAVDTGTTAQIWGGSGTPSASFVVPNSTLLNQPVFYVEALAAQSASLQEITISVKAGSKAVIVQSVACYEQWRPVLKASTSDSGINITSERARQPIFTGNYATTIESVGGIYSALAAADARRVAVFHWAVPDTNPVTRTGAYTTLLGLGQPVLTRQLTSGQTTGTVYWSAYAKVSASSGDVKLTTSHSGVSDSVNITGTSYAWTTPRAISIDCEDLSTTDGRRGSSWDELDVQIRGNGGATISVVAVSVWEQP